MAAKKQSEDKREGALPAGYGVIEFSPSGSQKKSTEENGQKETLEEGSKGRYREVGERCCVGIVCDEVVRCKM